MEDALEQLASWKIILFKKHINAWSVFEGSDFDIESAISQARGALPGVDFALLSSLTNLFPVIAKRHYHHTGTMRWMDMALCRLDEVERIAANFKPKGAFGLFLLALPWTLCQSQSGCQARPGTFANSAMACRSRRAHDTRALKISARSCSPCSTCSLAMSLAAIKSLGVKCRHVCHRCARTWKNSFGRPSRRPPGWPERWSLWLASGYRKRPRRRTGRGRELLENLE